MNIDRQIRQWAQLVNESEYEINEGIPEQRQKNVDFMNSLWLQVFNDKFYISTESRNGVLTKVGDKYKSMSFPIEGSQYYSLEDALQTILVFDSYDDAEKFIWNTFKITRENPQMVIVGQEYNRQEFPFKDSIRKVSSLSI